MTARRLRDSSSKHPQRDVFTRAQASVAVLAAHVVANRMKRGTRCAADPLRRRNTAVAEAREVPPGAVRKRVGRARHK